jgi:hypothetical protein
LEQEVNAKHLLKSPGRKVTWGRTKSKHYLTSAFRFARCQLLLPMAASQIALSEQSKAQQILVYPACVRDHGAQRSDGERVAQGVISKHHTPTISVAIDSMTSADALKDEAIGF